MGEEKLLLELMWIEHLSIPMSKRNLSAGLLAEWQRKCKARADVLPISNGVVVASRWSETQKRSEKLMARLQITMGSKMKRDGSEDSTTSSPVFNELKSAISDRVDAAVDDVISFNVGGTIIAVLRSTLLLQAPNSTFAARYSDRWVQQSDELDEFGNIYMVEGNILHLDDIFILPSLHPSSSPLLISYANDILI